MPMYPVHSFSTDHEESKGLSATIFSPEDSKGCWFSSLYTEVLFDLTVEFK